MATWFLSKGPNERVNLLLDTDEVVGISRMEAKEETGAMTDEYTIYLRGGAQIRVGSTLAVEAILAKLPQA